MHSSGMIHMQQFFEPIRQNVMKRMDKYIGENDGHIEDLLF